MRFFLFLLFWGITSEVVAQVFSIDEVDRLPLLLSEEEVKAAEISDISYTNELTHFYSKIRIPAICRQGKLYEEYHLTYFIDEEGRVKLDSLFSTPHAAEYSFDRWKKVGPDTITVTTYPSSHEGYKAYQPVLMDTLACREKTRKNIERIVVELPQYEPAKKDGHPVGFRREWVLLYFYEVR